MADDMALKMTYERADELTNRCNKLSSSLLHWRDRYERGSGWFIEHKDRDRDKIYNLDEKRQRDIES